MMPSRRRPSINFVVQQIVEPVQGRLAENDAEWIDSESLSEVWLELMNSICRTPIVAPQSGTT